jgi:hypothetical protein
MSARPNHNKEEARSEFDAPRPYPGKKLSLKVTALLLALVGSLASAHAGRSYDVWIDIRPDAGIGSGTEADPYEGSTEKRFDALMGPAGSLTGQPGRIHLGPGTFITRGIFLDVGSQLVGCGIDRTIIKLQSGSALIGRRTSVMQVKPGAAVGDEETSVSDFTADGNIAEQPKAPHDVCVSGGAVASHISRVKVIGLGTSLATTQMESFWVVSVSQSHANRPSYNQVIEDSICVAPTTPQYVTFFTSTGGNTSAEGPEDIATRNTIVRNCKVVCTTPTGTFDGHAFTFANCDSGILEDCYTDGITCGYYQDTWSSRKIAIRNNVFARVRFGVFFNRPAASVIDDLAVDGNLFELIPNRDDPENANGVRLYGTNARFVSITNNRIRIAPGLSTAGSTDGGIELRSGPTPDTQMNVTVRDNCIDIFPVQNRLLTMDGMKNKANLTNNYDSYGEDVLGDRYVRLTFIAPKSGWYSLWTQASPSRTSRAAMGGLVTVRTRALLGSGSVTLSGGAATISLPVVTALSRVVLKPSVALDGAGANVSVTLSPGVGFAVQSTDASDRSTYTYTVDTGEGVEACCFAVSSRQARMPAVLTQLYAGDPAGDSTETSCMGVKTYAVSGGQALWGDISGPSLVTVEIVPGSDPSQLESSVGRTGVPEDTTGGAGSWPVTTLTFNPAAGLVSTGPILAPNLPGPAGEKEGSTGNPAGTAK